MEDRQFWELSWEVNLKKKMFPRRTLYIRIYWRGFTGLFKSKERTYIKLTPKNNIC